MMPFSSVVRALPLAAVLFSVACSPEARRDRTLERAEAHYGAGELEKAKIEYLNVLQAEPEHLRALERMGAIWSEQGSTYRALPILLRVRTLAASNYANRARLAHALSYVGRLDDARKEATTVVQSMSTPEDTMILLADLTRNAADVEAAADALRRSSQFDSVWGLVAQAKLALRQGDAARARTLLQRASDKDPRSPFPSLARAEVELQAGDSEAVRSAFQRAAELAPPRSPIRVRYAEELIRRKAFPEATAVLKAALETAPDHLPARRALAQIALLEQNPAEARQRLTELFAFDTRDLEGRIIESQLDAAEGRLANAIRKLEGLNEGNPGFSILNLHLARLLIANGEVSRAVSVLREGVRSNPEHPELLLMLAELNLQQGQPLAVLPLAGRLLKQQPTHFRSQSVLINALVALRRFDDAAMVVREQVRQHPRQPDSHVQLGRIELQRGKRAEARAAFEYAHELAPDHLPIVAGLVELELRERNIDAAAQQVSRAREKHGDNAIVHQLDAAVLSARADWPAAEAAMRSALALNRDLPGADAGLVGILLSGGHPQKARDHLRETVQRRPHDGSVRLLLATLHQQLGEMAEARDAYEAVLTSNPNATLVLNNLAWLYAHEFKDLERGLQLARQARTLDPASPQVADTLGWILHLRGEHAEALPLLEESARKLPEVPEVQEHLRAVQAATGLPAKSGN